ncbi:hypothetical protein EON65_45090 [archaeon]|nr:MAG: hypothetical protein EON65_45090 [archaeon]
MIDGGDGQVESNEENVVRIFRLSQSKSNCQKRQSEENLQVIDAHGKVEEVGEEGGENYLWG